MFSFIYIMVYYLWTFFSSMMCIIYSSQYYFLLLWGCWTCRGGWACERKMFFFFKVWNVSLSWVCIISTFFYCIGGTKVTYLANVSYLHFSTAYSRYFIFFWQILIRMHLLVQYLYNSQIPNDYVISWRPCFTTCKFDYPSIQLWLYDNTLSYWFFFFFFGRFVLVKLLHICMEVQCPIVYV